MPAPARRRALLIASVLTILLLTFVHYKQVNDTLVYLESSLPSEEDCLVQPLELWPADLIQSFDQSADPLNCSSNGLRFTIEKPRETIDTDALLPKTAWLEQGRLKLSPNSNCFKCDAFPIFRLDEYRSVYGDPVVNVKSGHLLPHPQNMLICQPCFNLSSWNADILLTQRRFYLCGSSPVVTPTSTFNSTPVNILLLGVDSLSRLGWLRYMPKTVRKLRFLAKSRGAIFRKYHVVGDGTTSNLLALLTGFFEHELPESRRFASRPLGDHGGLLEMPIPGDKEYQGGATTPLDGFPWIWTEFKKKAGYATHFIEDSPNWGTFQYRLQGFGNTKQPVDSYGRPCMIAAAQDEMRYGKEIGCTASTPTHKVLLESLREFFYANSHLPRISLTFISEMMHEEASKAQLIDADIAQLLEQIDTEDEQGKGAFANTLLVLFSDHGPRIGKARLSLQGKLEERLPMLTIILPRNLARDWAEAVSTLQSNDDKLCSAFDLHATLKHLLTRPAASSARGRSLFTPLPWKRTCHDAGIARHWCTCVHWVNLKPNLYGYWPKMVTEAAQTTLRTINSATRVFFTQVDLGLVGLCERLELEKVISAEVSRVHHDVARFRGSADHDGRIPIFGKADAQPNTSALRLHLLMKPKEVHFEVLLYRNSCGFYPPSLDDIRRLDEYEEHAKCLEPHRWSHARKLCICR